MIKAIDICFLLPKQIEDLAIRLNKTVPQAENIKLDGVHHIPHITLLMGGVEQLDFYDLEEKVKAVVNGVAPLNLQIVGVDHGKDADGLRIESTSELQSLHEKIVNKISPMLSYEVILSGLHDSETAKPGIVNHINNFLINSARENYKPHITVVDGRLDESLLDLPIEFAVETLAITHMGTYGTSQKIFKTFKLS